MPEETPYHYTHNNPILYNDPSGMLPKYNWETGQYEDDDGKEVSFEAALAAHGIGQGNQGDKNDKEGQGDERDQQDQENKGIDLSSSKAGEQLVEALKNVIQIQQNDRKARRRSDPVYLEDLIDVTTSLSNTFGFGPVTSSTKGSRDIFGTRVEITIWLRRNLGGEYLTKSDENQIYGARLNRGKTNPVNKRLESSVLIRNRATGAGVIQFKVYDNPDFAQKLYDYLNNREPITIDNK